MSRLTDLIQGLPRQKEDVRQSPATPPRDTPLSPAAEARRRKVLALARDGKRYAVYVEDPNTDPVIMATATPDGSCELQMPRGRYDVFRVLEMVRGWEA